MMRTRKNNLAISFIGWEKQKELDLSRLLKKAVQQGHRRIETGGVSSRGR